MPLQINGATSGSTTIQATDAVTATITLPSTTSSLMINGPAFSAYSSVNQSVSSATLTKVTLGTEEFDTNSNFASSRFTPTVAGYYQINGQTYTNASSLLTYCQSAIYKNGSLLKLGTTINTGTPISEFSSNCNAVVYCNGSTDYIELYTYGIATGGVVVIGGGTFYTYLSGALVRTA